MRAVTTFAALPFVLSILAAPVATEDVRLTWKFREGDVMRYRMVQEMEQAVTGPGEFETKSNVSQVLKQTVKSVSADGIAAIECTWEALRFHMNVPMGGDVDFDSTHGDTESNVSGPLKGLIKLVGSTFRMEMKPNGEIVSIHGIAEVMEAVFSGDDPETQPMRTMMSQMFTDESMKRMMEASVLPEQALAIGDTWTRDIEVPMGPIGKVKVHSDYALDSVGTTRGVRCAKVAVKQTMSLADGKPDFSAMPFAEQFDIFMTIDDSKGEGALYYAIERGGLAEFDLDSHTEMSMKMAPKGDAESNMPDLKMNIEMDMKISMVLLGPEEPAFEPEKKDEKR